MGKRIVWMDVARFLAILLVILIHSTDEIMASVQNVSTRVWLIYQSIRIIGRTGVPIFFFLSGALILKEARNSDIITFYKNKIPKMIILTVIYFFATNIIISLSRSNPIDITKMASSFLLGDTLRAYQLWFMFSIIELYFIAPFLSRMVHNLKTTEIMILISLNIFFFNLPSLISTLFGIGTFLSKFGSDFLGGNLVYFLLGYVTVNRDLLGKTKARLIVLSFLFFFFMLLYFQYFLRISHNFVGEGYTWYNSILIMLASFSIFALLSKIDFNGKHEELFFYLSKSSFCVFLFHLIPLEILVRTHLIRSISIHWKILLCFSLTYVLCIIYYFIMHRIPYIKKLVL